LAKELKLRFYRVSVKDNSNIDDGKPSDSDNAQSPLVFLYLAESFLAKKNKQKKQQSIGLASPKAVNYDMFHKDANATTTPAAIDTTKQPRAGSGKKDQCIVS
jgi:hypothetical protein